MKYIASFWSRRARHVRDPIIRWYGAECERLVESARPYGLTPVIWSEQMLRETEFYRRNRAILDLPHFGWLFKPAVTLFVMQQLQDGDLLLYSDSNHILQHDPQPILDLAVEHGVWCHRHSVGSDYPNGDWTKRDAFVMMECDAPQYWDEPQTQVNFYALSKTPCVMRFVEEWVYYSSDPHIETDCPNICGLPNLPGFREHRWEQSVFSLLRQRYGMPMFPEPTGLYIESVMGERC